MKLTRTGQGHLLIWERGTTRYTLGYHISRTLKRWYWSHGVIAVRPFSVHFVRYPMTDGEKQRRGL